MLKWNWLARSATVAVSALGSLTWVASPARADERPVVEPLTLSPQFLDETVPGSVAPGAPRSRSIPIERPLMALLESAGIAGPLDAARINIKGWVEGS